jgi:hypothetical protein
MFAKIVSVHEGLLIETIPCSGGIEHYVEVVIEGPRQCANHRNAGAARFRAYMSAV